MKILQLGKFYPIRGGVEKVMWDLTMGLRERGVECDMLCAKLGADAFEGNDEGKVITVRALSKKAGTMIAPEMISRMRKICSGYDIIHVHHPDPMAALALRLSGYKGRVVLHWHSDILSQKTLKFFYRPLQNWLIRRADRIVCTTPSYLAASPDLEGFRDKGAVVPIGIKPMTSVPKKDVAEFRAKYGNRKIILSVGRLIPYKGYDNLVGAAKYLPEDHIVLIGGEGPLRKELEEKISALGLKNKVLLLGYLPKETLPLLFAASDVFVLSSVMKTEAFGIVQIEAMSAGKPVVATKIQESGVSWVNLDGVSGLNVEPGDPKAIAGAVEVILQDYDRFSAGAAKRFRENFTEDKMIERIVKIYEELL
ncbi:MAG: glycosyltransferase [Bacteroidales bacterium]|nr:glycosyltransferase [Bacteroidales bacterium]